MDSDFPSSFIDVSPESQEMDRTEAPPWNPACNSLSYKLKAHYRKGMGKTQFDTTPTQVPVECINRVAPILTLMTILSSLVLGVLDVIPALYEGRGSMLLFQQCLIIFIVTQVMVNWLGVRFVSSSYSRYISLHGDPHLHKQIRLKSKEEVFVNSDLEEEAKKVNKLMNESHELINSRSIADLIHVSKDYSNTSPSLHPSLEMKQQVFDIMSPKPVIRVEGGRVTESYPYWSWAPCYSCRRTRPPRCHHCPLCGSCILKRYHHCFFAGACIGFRNHRFFLVFLVWAWLGCMYGMYHGLLYLSVFVWPKIASFDLLFPLALLRLFTGYVSLHTLFFLTTLYPLIFFVAFIPVYMFSQLQLISSGLTSFEQNSLTSSLEVKDTRKLSEKLRAIFGTCWLVNFLIPTIMYIDSAEDPVNWPHIRVFKH